MPESVSIQDQVTCLMMSGSGRKIKESLMTFWMEVVSFIDLFGLIRGRWHETEITAYECESRYGECATATRAIRSYVFRNERI